MYVPCQPCAAPAQVTHGGRCAIRPQRNASKGFTLALLATFLLSTNFITAKYAMRGFDPNTFSLVWTTAASVYGLAVVLASGQRAQMRLPRASWKGVALLGLATGIGMILNWTGLSQLDPAFASFLNRLQPLITILLGAVFLGERLSPRVIPPALLMVVGGMVSAAGDWHIVATGVILTLLGAVTLSFQWLLGKINVFLVTPNVLVFYRNAGAWGIVLAWTLLSGGADFRVGASYWAVALIGAALGPVTSHLLTMRSHLYWDLWQNSIVSTLQPLFVLPLAYLAFGETPTGLRLVGGLVILAGAFWLVWVYGNTRLVRAFRSAAAK